MTNDLKVRFKELLEEDLARARQRLDAWKMLVQHGARLENLEGNVVATAADMIKHWEGEIKRLEEFIVRYS